MFERLMSLFKWGRLRLSSAEPVLQAPGAELSGVRRNPASSSPVRLEHIAAVLTHELRGPLASLKGHAQLLEEGLEPGTESQLRAARVVREALRLEQVTLQLLEFWLSSRVELRQVEINGFIRELLEEIGQGRVLFFSNGHVLNHPVDPVRLGQALTHLIRSALEVSPEESMVEVELDAGEDAVSIMVRDRGEGIPPGREEQLFEPYSTLLTRSPGLSLTVSRRVAELHNGTLTARNRRDGGTEFILRMGKPVRSTLASRPSSLAGRLPEQV